MISLAISAAQPFQTLRGLREQAAPATAREKTSAVALPSLAGMRDGQKAQRKAMAAKKVQAVRERMDALKLMVKIDPRAALKMTAQLAKELKSAVKDYVDAGGKNVTDGDMAMIRRQALEARDAADVAAEGVPAEAGAADAETPTVDAEAVDAGTKRAQAAYGAAAEFADGRDQRADRLGAVEGAAMADQDFFQQVRLALGDLKDAREKIKANWTHPRQPDKDDWKAADRAMAELEKAIDFAPTGAPEPLAAVSTKA